MSLYQFSQLGKFLFCCYIFFINNGVASTFRTLGECLSHLFCAYVCLDNSCILAIHTYVF